MIAQKKHHWGFIGMSGIGKSYWTKQLGQIGFTAIDCDAKVIAEVSKQVNIPFSTLSEAGTWMQLPNQEGFEQREALFMQCEKQVIERAIDAILNKKIAALSNSRYILDMGGSAIYIGDDILSKLKQNLLLIYFDVSEEVYETMLQNYFANPCPVIWQGKFKRNISQNLADNFLECYANLINYRRNIYLNLADIVIPYGIHRQPNWKPEDFLTWIEAYK
jgi:shikimate kinase